MYVCLCYGLTEKDIAKNIKNGCLSVKKLQQFCKAGTSCGACLLELNKMIKNSQDIKKLQVDSDCNSDNLQLESK